MLDMVAKWHLQNDMDMLFKIFNGKNDRHLMISVANMHDDFQADLQSSSDMSKIKCLDIFVTLSSMGIL